MNELLTINVNNFMSANARASLQAAAERWGAGYREVTTCPSPSLHPCFGKFEAVLASEAEQVAYFDADMLISERAPSPFAAFPDRDRIYAVRDQVERYALTDTYNTEVRKHVHIPYHAILEAQIKLGVDYHGYLYNFFNAGFFVIDPWRHRNIMRMCQDWRPKQSVNGHAEQALFNYAVQATARGALTAVPETWNYLNPDVSVRSMQAYVYHFTGWAFKDKGAIADFPWRT